jgi:hypothetical protein
MVYTCALQIVAIRHCEPAKQRAKTKSINVSFSVGKQSRFPFPVIADLIRNLM